MIVLGDHLALCWDARMRRIDVLSHGFPSGFVVSGQSRARLAWLLFVRLEQEQILQEPKNSPELVLTPLLVV